MIEHRYTKRVAVSENASIYHRGTFVAGCKIKDISVDGMAMWAGPLQYHRNTMLEVELDNSEQGRQDKVRLCAIVGYSTAKALGLMFTQVNEAAQTKLRNIMLKAAVVNSDQTNTGNGWDSVTSTQPV